MRSRKAAALALLLVFASADAVDDKAARDLRRAAKLTDQGLQALQSGNVNKARRIYRTALEISPLFPEAHLGLGQIAMRERDFGSALDSFRDASAGYRLMGGSLFELRMERFTEARGKLAVHRSRLVAMTGELDRLTTTDGGRRQIRATVSRLQAEIVRTEGLIQQLQAIEPPTSDMADPVPGEVHFYIGNALQRMGRVDEAIESWNRCAERTPSFPLVHYNLAVAYWQLDRPEEARRSLTRAEELGFRGNPGFRAELARSLAAREAAARASAGD